MEADDVGDVGDVAERRLPGSLAPLVVGGMLAASAVAFAMGWLLEGLVEFDIAVVVLVGALLYGTLIAVAQVVRERVGGRSLAETFAFRFGGWGDVALGFLVFVMATVLSIVVGSVFVESERFRGENTELFRHFRDDVFGYAVVVVLAVVVAPLVEELFFRGLLQPVLIDRYGVERGLVGQAALFGLVHISPSEGTHNVSVVVVVAAMGWVFGWAAHHYGRLGPGIVAHAMRNALSVTVVYFAA